MVGGGKERRTHVVMGIPRSFELTSNTTTIIFITLKVNKSQSK
jgi:hypothetical protein